MADRESMFHEQHRALQDRFDGRRVADALEKNRRLGAFGPDHVALIEGAAFFFLATAHAGSVDCSVKGGPPGFVRVAGPEMLEWPDFDGNSMYRSLGNILGTPEVGMLFLSFDGRATKLRVNGRAEILFDHPLLAHWAGAKSVIRVTAREIFPNCPRGLPVMEAVGPNPWWPGADRVPRPDWKGRDYIREILPKDDPHRV